MRKQKETFFFMKIPCMNTYGEKSFHNQIEDGKKKFLKIVKPKKKTTEIKLINNLND